MAYRIPRTRSFVAALLLMAAASTHANLLTNGDFEASPGHVVGTTSLSGWVVHTGNIDRVAGLWPALLAGHGTVVDLNGHTIGGISQSFATTAGTTYVLTFEYGRNPDNTQSGNKPFDVSVIGSAFAASITNPPSNTGWTAYTQMFTATGTTATLNFLSTTTAPVYAPTSQAAWGPLLDNVSVTAVPEPAGYALALAGVGLLGLVGRRRTAR